jgi:TRAP-type C4-dicarboxylate transport system permease large subunit
LTGAWRELAAAPILEPFSAGDVCVGVVAGAAILVVITWLRLVDNLWVGLSGEPWLIRTVAIIGSIAWLPVSYSVWWLYQRPTGLTTLQTVAFAAVVVKFVLAAWLARRLVCRRILGAPSVTLSLVAWMTVAVGAITLMSKLLPAERVPLVLAAAGIMLLMPLNRLAAAPLVLAWNRHR